MSEGIEREPPDRAEADWLDRLWRRVREHKMVQWSVAYVALAYGIQHGVVLTSESLDWPHAVARVTMILLALGLPLVVTLAWYHGERASRKFSQAELSILSVLLVIGSLFFYVFVQPSEEIAAAPPAAKEAGVTAARAASVSVGNAISIAVLPFANVSGDASQEFFSDGMSDEITGALTKIADLRVVGRTSAFQFKGQNKDLRTIGQTLGATHLIDGSVRKAGNRVRITVQLIKADDGVNIWGDTYDRELTDVFAVQEEIGRAIAGALRMPLGLAPGENLVSNRTQDLGTYQDYLQAKAWFRARLTPNSGPYTKTLESVVTRNPSFAPAWGLLARAYAVFGDTAGGRVGKSVEDERLFIKSFLDKAEMAGMKAIQLDPENVEGYSGLTEVHRYRGQWAVAEDSSKKALAVDPNDAVALRTYGALLLVTGHLRQSLNTMQRQRTLDPLIPAFNIITAYVMLANRQNKDAIAFLEAMPATTGRRNQFLARAYAIDGRYAEAADTILLIRAANPVFQKFRDDAAQLMRSAPAKVAAPQALPANISRSEYNFIFAHIGAIDRVMEYPEREVDVGYIQDLGSVLWLPDMAPLRKTERFKALLRKVGLVDYWKARGWPDLCHPTTSDDFECN